jgi:hypothetical protein
MPKAPLVVLSTAFPGCDGLPGFISLPIPARTPDPHDSVSPEGGDMCMTALIFPGCGRSGHTDNPPTAHDGTNLRSAHRLY